MAKVYMKSRKAAYRVTFALCVRLPCIIRVLFEIFHCCKTPFVNRVSQLHYHKAILFEQG